MADGAAQHCTDDAAGGAAPSLEQQLREATEELRKSNEEKNGLQMQLELDQGKVKRLEQEIERMRRETVNLQSVVEQEEEYISNQLLKKIQQLKKEKEMLALTAEQEEEYLTNTLQKKLDQTRQEKVELERQLEVEQEFIVNRLQKQLEASHAQVKRLQGHLEQLKREKVELERQVEAEQEFIVNRLQKRLGRLEAERSALQAQLSLSPRPSIEGTETEKMELKRLKDLITQNESKLQDMQEDRTRLQYENLQLKQRVHREVERMTSMARGVARIENELEMEDEKQFNVMKPRSSDSIRCRRSSSPIPCHHMERRVSVSSSTGSIPAKWWTRRSEPGTVRQANQRHHSTSSADGPAAGIALEHSNSMEGRVFMAMPSDSMDCIEAAGTIAP